MPIAIGRERFLSGMGTLGDSRVVHHARGALQRVSQAEEASKGLLSAAASLQFEYGLVESLQEFPCFDPEVLVLVLCHSSGTRSCLNEPDQIERQSRQLPRRWKCRARRPLCFLGSLCDVGNRYVDLLHGRGLLLRAEFDLSCGRRGRPEQLRDLLDRSGYFRKLPRTKVDCLRA